MTRARAMTNARVIAPMLVPARVTRKHRRAEPGAAVDGRGHHRQAGLGGDQAGLGGDVDRYQLFRSRNNWYLQAAPELLALAADRLGHFLGDLP